jgi:hypothetical protein
MTKTKITLIVLSLIWFNIQAQERFETPERTLTITAEGQKWEEVYHITTLGQCDIPLTFDIVSDLEVKNTGICTKCRKCEECRNREHNFRKIKLEFSTLLKYRGFKLRGWDNSQGEFVFRNDKVDYVFRRNKAPESENKDLTFHYCIPMEYGVLGDPKPHHQPAKETVLEITYPDCMKHKLPLNKAGTIIVECKDEDDKVLYTYFLQYDNTFFKVWVNKSDSTPYPCTYETKIIEDPDDRHIFKEKWEDTNVYFQD